MIKNRRELEESIVTAKVEAFCQIINRALGDNLKELGDGAVLALSSSAEGFNVKMKKKLVADLTSFNHLDLDLTNIIKRKFSELYVDKPVIQAVTNFLDKSGWGYNWVTYTEDPRDDRELIGVWTGQHYNWVTYTEDPRDPLVIILALFRKDIRDGNI